MLRYQIFSNAKYTEMSVGENWKSWFRTKPVGLLPWGFISYLNLCGFFLRGSLLPRHRKSTLSNQQLVIHKTFNAINYQ